MRSCSLLVLLSVIVAMLVEIVYTYHFGWVVEVEFLGHKTIMSHWDTKPSCLSVVESQCLSVVEVQCLRETSAFCGVIVMSVDILEEIFVDMLMSVDPKDPTNQINS